MAKKPKKRPGSKGILLILSLTVLCLSILSGSTLAYLVTGTNPIANIFNHAVVSCKVLGGNSRYAENVCIQNTGNIPAYIRAAIVVTFEREGDDGNTTVSSLVPEEGDYRIQFAENTNWKKGPDGFWYYTQPVAVNQSTETLILDCAAQKSVAPDGFTLTIKVVASAIQASGTQAVTDSWSSGVQSRNGDTLVIREAASE